MTTVVIMAGGRGLRLHPLTEKTPKPMLPVGEHPMLETIIDRYIRQGIKSFVLCVGYKAGLIMHYFGDGSSKGIRITYVHETEPLGTAGALKIWKRNKLGPIIVANADVLCHLEVDDLLKYHIESDCHATMVVTTWLQQVPFGVVKFNGDARVNAIDEKPIVNHIISAGINVLSPDAFKYLPPQDRFDMPDFLLGLPSVAAYVLPDGQDWHDVGTFQDYEVANGRVP